MEGSEETPFLMETPDTDPNDKGEKRETRLRNIRRKVKASQRRATLFKFLFFEYKKIRDFGDERHVLHPRMLPPGIQLNKNIQATLTKHVQPLSIDLYKVLTYILRRKWAQLTRKEYNLIVLFKQFCKKLALTNFILLNYGDRDLVDRLRSIETYFLAFHTDTGYAGILLSAVSRVLEKDAKHKEHLPDALVSIKRILFNEIDTPSLYDVILGLNMIKYRRYFRLQDLVSRNCGEIVSADAFECGEDIQKDIDAFVRECRENIQYLAGKKREIEGIKKYFSTDEKGAVDITTLRYLYESWQPEELHSLTHDSEDIIQLTIRLLHMFRDCFKTLLCGEVNLFGLGRRRVFPQGFFDTEFRKIPAFVRQLESASYDQKSAISLGQYEESGSKDESASTDVMVDVLFLFYKIGNKLEEMLRRNAPEGNLPRARMEASGLRGDDLDLPLNEKIATHNSTLRRKSVAEALVFVISTCYQICYLYHDKRIYDPLAREQMVSQEISLKMEMLSRMADPEVYQSIKEIVFPAVFGEENERTNDEVPAVKPAASSTTLSK